MSRIPVLTLFFGAMLFEQAARASTLVGNPELVVVIRPPPGATLTGAALPGGTLEIDHCSGPLELIPLGGPLGEAGHIPLPQGPVCGVTLVWDAPLLVSGRWEDGALFSWMLAVEATEGWPSAPTQGDLRLEMGLGAAPLCGSGAPLGPCLDTLSDWYAAGSLTAAAP